MIDGVKSFDWKRGEGGGLRARSQDAQTVWAGETGGDRRSYFAAGCADAGVEAGVLQDFEPKAAKRAGKILAAVRRAEEIEVRVLAVVGIDGCAGGFKDGADAGGVLGVEVEACGEDDCAG